ncbi:hypothetical protein SAMN03159423_4842 [Bradyrhizobium sp. NFR13]|uniref:hypothetical protein n=1 Tax=Bradyrhizobium sp. NFR13 TaxID=1566285 RepID=UPI0008E5CF78|nr:hypothetical protein [Bradyrhizobium sp. NFR13]SFM00286.1 hypothetical protein SAMN03159423_4842 [Bradyrhizobium sp. NFR13]
MPKIEMDIEKLLHWAFRDELSKRAVSAAEGIWDRIQENQHHGGIDRSHHGAGQRYAQIGLPHPDAERIERAVTGLQMLVVEWDKCIDIIAGDLGGLITINDVAPSTAPKRVPKVGWGAAGNRALKGMFGPGAERLHQDRPRDVIMVAGIRTDVLVAMHAIKGTRPDWFEEQPQPKRVQAERGVNAKIIGECRGKDLYTVGSYCPLRYDPSPMTVVHSRADYAAWHRGLLVLSETLELEKFVALPPKAPATPWFEDEVEERSRVLRPSNLWPASHSILPLSPERERTRSPLRRSKASPVRYPLEATSD